MTDREVMQMALEALEVNVCTWDEKAKAMTALRARLAEPSRAERMRAAGFTRRPTLRELAYADPDPDPEPEMWGSPDGYWVENQYLYLRSDRECFTIPLYTAPPTRRPLTEKEILEILPDAQHGWTTAFYGKWVSRAIERAHGIGEER